MIPASIILASRYRLTSHSAFMFFVIIVLVSFVAFTAWDSSVEDRK